MKPITVSNWIHASPAAVFAKASDLGSAAAWLSGVTALELLTPGPVGVGTRFRETRKFGGRESTEEMTVAAFDPPRSYKIQCDSHGTHFATVMMFEADRDGTIVSMDTQIRPVTLLAKLMSPLMRMITGKLRQCLAQDLADLKRAAEATGRTEVASVH